MASLDDHFAHRWMGDRAQKSTPNWELYILLILFSFVNQYTPIRSSTVK
jgi:hypothetical protein